MTFVLPPFSLSSEKTTMNSYSKILIATLAIFPSVLAQFPAGFKQEMFHSADCQGKPHQTIYWLSAGKSQTKVELSEGCVTSKSGNVSESTKTSIIPNPGPDSAPKTPSDDEALVFTHESNDKGTLLRVRSYKQARMKCNSKELQLLDEQGDEVQSISAGSALSIGDSPVFNKILCGKNFN